MASGVNQKLQEHTARVEKTLSAAYRGHRDCEDIVQAVRIAAWRSSLTVDVSRRGWRSYIRRRMQAAALRWLRDNGQMIRVPRHEYERGVRIPVTGIDEIDDLPAR